MLRDVAPSPERPPVKRPKAERDTPPDEQAAVDPFAVLEDSVRAKLDAGAASRLAREGRWHDMGALVDDELIETIAVVGEPHQVADRIRDRLRGISDSVSLVNNRAPDPEHLAEVVHDLHQAS